MEIPPHPRPSILRGANMLVQTLALSAIAAAVLSSLATASPVGDAKFEYQKRQNLPGIFGGLLTGRLLNNTFD